MGWGWELNKLIYLEQCLAGNKSHTSDYLYDSTPRWEDEKENLIGICCYLTWSPQNSAK